MSGDDQPDLFGGGLPRSPRTGQVGPAPLDENTLRLAQRVPSGVRLGTSSWSFPGWTDIVYDRRASEKVLAREGLAAYARHPLLRCVGIDRSYYAPVDTQAFRDYAAAVPDDFRFLVKALDEVVLPRFPDHPRYQRRRGDRNKNFLDPGLCRDVVVQPFSEGLGEKGLALLLQFPPMSTERWRQPENFAEELHRFLDQLPRGIRYAIELRTPALLTPTYLDALTDLGAVHCYNVWTGMPSLPTQAEAIPTDHADLLLVRWMLPPGLDYQVARERFEPFDALVAPDPDRRHRIRDLLREGLERGQEVVCIVNNKAEGSSPLSVVELARALAPEATP